MRRHNSRESLSTPDFSTPGLLVRGFEELLDCQSCFCNQATQRASCNFLVIWYRESGHVAWFRHDDMTTFLTNYLPAKALKHLDDVGRGRRGTGGIMR